MNTIWFVVLGTLLIGYAVLDGLDLGIGSLHLLLGKTDAERRTNLMVIGPHWAGFEVWLLTAGGSMVAAFPRLYAASFSGFYIVLNLVLWLLIMRGGALEFRSHIASPLWRQFWDVIFCISSALLAVLFGAAVGNIVRGVPLDAAGNFQGSLALALNPYAIVVGVFSLVLLAMHGANLIAAKTTDIQRERARVIASVLWYAVAALAVVSTALAFWARRSVGVNFRNYPVLFVLPLLVAVSLIAVRVLQSRNDFGKAVIAGAALLTGLMGSAGASLYPYLLPELGSTTGGLTIYNAAAPRHNLETALVAIVAAMSVVIGYHLYIHKVFAGTVHSNVEEHSY